jgi:hypothetical protein
MITPAEWQSCWSDRHEAKNETANQQGIFRGSRARPAPRRQERPQNRPHVRHARLRLEERQSRR